MSLHLQDAWTAVSGSPVFAVALTLAAYQVGRTVWRRSGNNPLLNPVLVAVVLVATALWALGIDYDTYLRGSSMISLLLGPAVVALAWPLHLELALVRRTLLPVVVGVVVGSGVAVASAVLVTAGLGGDATLTDSMAPKTATTPVAIALSEQIGGVPALTAVLTILTGILGAVAGSRVLTWLRFRDRRVRGLAVGVASHGIGTAQMLVESRTEGAFAGLAMALTALATSVWVALLVPVLT